MLRFEPYSSVKHNISLVSVFNAIYNTSEIPYLEEFQNTNLSYVCTDRHSNIQGFILVRNINDDSMAKYEISYIGVMPRYRKNGYTKRLLDLVKSASKDMGVRIDLPNIDIINLDNSTGFDVVDTLIEYISVESYKYISIAIHKCYHCQVLLNNNELIWEDTNTSFIMTTYGLKNVINKETVCWKCMSKVES